MRFVLVVAALVALCGTQAFAVDTSQHAKWQKDIFQLFKYINQPDYYQEHVDIAEKYKFYENKALYSTKPDVVDEFYQYYKYDSYLQKGEIFSIFHEQHLKQAVALFKLFYYAKDFKTFYESAVWARHYLNEGLFLYSFSVALIHRPDTYFIVLPPIYEIYPHYFYSSEVIEKAQYYKQMYNGKSGEYNEQYVIANYSGYYLNLHPEQSMSYFMEDVEINSFYYYYNMYYPFWMSGEEFHLKYDNRGEVFYYMYQQILARFYLERLSNDFGEIEYFNWETPFPVGYYPSMQYPNGLEFPTRPQFANLYEYFYNYGQKWSFKAKYGYSHSFVEDYEKRIHDAIDSGYVYTAKGEPLGIFTQEGFQKLGNLIEGNPDSPFYHYYGAYQVFARHLLGYSYQALDQHKLYPSALEHFETSMRDPAFYMLYKKLITFFYRYKYQHVKPYTESDLYYQGVNVEKVEFDRLVTYFDYDFHSDLSNAVYVTPDEYNTDQFKVYAKQERLNHKPFTYKVYVNSDKEVEASVHVYMGPKYDEYGRYINLSENYLNFVQFDHFTYKLKSGQNTIVRNSKEIYNYMHDRTSYYELYQKAFGVYDKTDKFSFYGDQFFFGFPQRFMLPKGSYDGVSYQFFVIVSKYVDYKPKYPEFFVGSGNQYVDAHPMGYPFDKPIYFEKMYYDMPNGYFYDVKVYHRDNDQANVVKD